MERVGHQGQRVYGITGDEFEEEEGAVDYQQDDDSRRLGEGHVGVVGDLLGGMRWQVVVKRLPKKKKGSKLEMEVEVVRVVSQGAAVSLCNLFAPCCRVLSKDNPAVCVNGCSRYHVLQSHIPVFAETQMRAHRTTSNGSGGDLPVSLVTAG